MPKAKPLTIYAKRRADTDRKLRAALERLMKGLPTHPDLKPGGYRVSVATLAKEARIARSAIYANHASLIDEIARLSAAPDTQSIASWSDKQAEQRAVIAQMKLDARRIVTENAALLKRALDAEAEAQSLRRRNARLIADRDGPQPFTLAAQRVMKNVSGS